MASKRSKPRHGFALMLTVLVLTILIAVTADLTTLASTSAMAGGRRLNTFHHELAVDSALLRINDELRAAEGAELRFQLEAVGSANASFLVGNVKITARIQSDAVKLNPQRWSSAPDLPVLMRKLSWLQQQLRLPGRLQPRPIRGDSAMALRWFDQLTVDAEPGDYFPLEMHDDSRSTWSQAVTFWGDGKLDLRFVEADVLEAALEDIKPGMAQSLVAKRPPASAGNLAATALEAVPAELRSQVAERVGFDIPRYAIRLETALGADRRQWCVVAVLRGEAVQTLYRGQIEW